MLKRHTTFYINEVKPLNFCGKIIGYETTGGSFENPFEIKPTEGEHDFNKCEGCKETLTQITKHLKGKFEGNKSKKGFPFCCEFHANLVNIKEFNKAFFVSVPEMVAKKVVYTNQHIVNNHTSENWYKKISDYIEWVIESFGQMPMKCGEPLYLGDYFHYIAEMLKRNPDIPKEKKNKILEYLNSYQIPNENPQTDLNVLLNTYQKWFKIFPFELNSYFGHLKQHFEKQLPIVNGKPETNIYSGMTKVKMHTKNSLFEALINLTNNLLTQINGERLYKMGLISNANEIKLQLIISSRKLKLKQGYKSKSPKEEQRYTDMLKEWFKDEKKFIDEITPLINSESDIDYMKGEVTFHFYPQGETGYFEVEKNNSKRRYTPEKVYDLELKNWELAIDNAPTKKEKLQAANNAIFRFRKDYLEYTHPIVEPLKEKVIKHLQDIKECINSSYEDSPTPQQTELINHNQQRFELTTKMYIVSYFKNDSIEINLFTPNNNTFKEAAKLDLEDIRKGEAINDFTIATWRTNDLSLNIIREAHHKDFVTLLNDKFNEAKINQGYKIIETFCKDEAKDLKLRYSKYFDWFPILRQWCGFLEGYKNLPPQHSETEQLGNDLIKSTIEDYLQPFEKKINPSSYKNLVEYLKEYFDTGKFPLNMNEIKINKVAKKAFGWALNEIFRACKTNNEVLPYQYLEFGKKYISIFKNAELTNTNMNKSTLYKYYTTKTVVKKG